MFVRVSLGLTILAAFVVAPAAAADGPLFASQGGVGVAANSGGLRYVAVGVLNSPRTELEAIQMSDGAVQRWIDLRGSWGIPTVGYSYSNGQGLSTDGRTLILESQTPRSPTGFLVVNTNRMTVVKRLRLPGYFSYDALSPDGSRLYLIQYVHSDLGRYIVRAYDMRSHRLLPARIADRTQKSWIMQGSAVTRTTSADARWVYTLYQNPGGYPFIHALDTVRGVAHCVGLPLEDQSGIYNVVLALHGRTLSVHWRSGRRWLNLDTATWRLSPSPGGFPWFWVVGAAGAALAAAGLTGARARRRGTRAGGVRTSTSAQTT